MLQIRATPNRDYLLPQLASNVQAAARALFSFRHLNPSYIGPVVQLRHGSTSEIKDFYASSSGDLRDTLSTLTRYQTPDSWLGANLGYISTWYDQSGQGLHASQSNPDSQPYLVRRLTTQYSAHFSGSQALYYGFSNTWTGSNYTFLIKEQRHTSNVFNLFLGTQNAVTNGGLQLGYRFNNALIHGQYNNEYTISLDSQWFMNSNVEPIRTLLFAHDNSAGKHTSRTQTAAQINNKAPLVEHGQPFIGSATGFYYYIGDIYEVFMFNQSLPVLDPNWSSIQTIFDSMELTTTRTTVRQVPSTVLTSNYAYSLVSEELASNLTGIFSCRWINSNYTGPLIQLRHGGTGNLLDFYGDPQGTQLTSASNGSFESWIGSQTAYVRTWYDQSGSNMHATQTTNAIQPILQYFSKYSSYGLTFASARSNVLLYSTANASNVWVNSDYTFVIKERRTNGTRLGNYFLGTAGNTTNNGLHLGYSYPISISQRQYANDYDVPVPEFKNTLMEPIRTWAFCHSATSAPGKWIYYNGKLFGVRANQSGLVGTAQPYIGRGYGPNRADGYDGEIYEIWMFRAALPATTTGPAFLTNIANNLRFTTPKSQQPLPKITTSQLDSRMSTGIPPSILSQAIAVYSPRRVVPSWKGPILKLYKNSDATQADVFINKSGLVTRVVSNSAQDNATSGGTITYSDAYIIHRFTSNGTFTTQTARDIELLIVGGGGGGGSSSEFSAGGGGGGGEVVTLQLSIPPGSTQVIVGQGGASDTAGQSSSFGTYVAFGGGAGGSNGVVPTTTGGSGGGGATNTAGGTSQRYLGYGSNGGASTASNAGGAGGGGAGALGGGASNDFGGNGGIGFQSSITGAWLYYGSGGGGGRFSALGSNGTPGSNAQVANQGGGGNGAEASLTPSLGSNGQNGVVIIRTLRHPGFLGSNAVIEWLGGSTYYVSQVYDQTGNRNNMTMSRGQPQAVFNSDNSIYGSTSAGMASPLNVPTSTYTLFAATQYNGGTRGRVLNAYQGTFNWLVGHHNNRSGVAFHQNAWVTPQVDQYGSQLVVSTDTNNPGMYRANNSNYTISTAVKTAPNRFALGDGYLANTTETSDWLAKDIYVFPRTLSSREITYIERCLYRTLLGPLDYLRAPSKATNSFCYSTLLSTTTYTGPIMRIINSRTNAEEDFYGNFHAELGTARMANGASLRQWLFPDPLSNARLLHWYDQSGNSRHMSNLNVPLSWSKGIPCVDLTSNFMTPWILDYNSNLPYSFELTFLNPVSPGVSIPLIGSSNISTINLLPDYTLEIQDSNITLATSNTYADGKWHHAVKSVSTTAQSLYIDGSLVLTAARSSNIPDLVPVGFGNASIITARSYTTALTAQEVSDLCRSRGF